MKFLEKFIPTFEMEVLRESLRGEEGKYFAMLTKLKRQIYAVPRLGETENIDPENIRIWMHYFYGATDIWVYELDIKTLESTAFVCLNGDTENAECGPVFLPEYIGINIMQIDLYWDTETTLKQVIDSVRIKRWK